LQKFRVLKVKILCSIYWQQVYYVIVIRYNLNGADLQKRFTAHAHPLSQIIRKLPDIRVKP